MRTQVHARDQNTLAECACESLEPYKVHTAVDISGRRVKDVRVLCLILSAKERTLLNACRLCFGQHSRVALL